MEAKEKPIALFIGRFQPFHKGHLFALRWIAARSSRVIVAIGSAQEKGTAKNPYSAQERKAMLRAVLAKEKLARKCGIFLVPDVAKDNGWIAHLDSRVPPYDVCFSSNARVLRLMRAAGKKVAIVPLLKRDEYNATKIREMMRKGKEWEGRVPRTVLKKLERIGTEKRISRS